MTSPPVGSGESTPPGGPGRLTASTLPAKATFPVERTLLAWDRTALAVLGNGSLLLVRHLRSPTGPVLAAAAVALAVMIVVAVLGRRRARRLHDPTTRASVAREPLVAGIGVVLVGVGVVTVLVISLFNRA